MIPTHFVRPLGVSAASGLVLRHGSFHVVADDENAMFVFKTDGPVHRVALLPGDLPTERKSRKASKPDFEILIDLGHQGLLAMGSGSRVSRERAVQIDRHDKTSVIDTSFLCACLRETFPELNLEGGVLLGEDLVLAQRGNRSDRRNAVIFIAKGDLQRALDSRVFVLTRAPRIVDLQFGQHESVPWSCTDLALLDDGDLLASVVLEDTRDAYEDGACLGSALARISPEGELRWHRLIDTASKVEGVAVDGHAVWLVTDADNRLVPSQLLRTTLL